MATRCSMKYDSRVVLPRNGLVEDIQGLIYITHFVRGNLWFAES